LRAEVDIDAATLDDPYPAEKAGHGRPAQWAFDSAEQKPIYAPDVPADHRFNYLEP